MFVIVEEMMVSEAAVCSAPSKLFRGICFSDSNCSSVCEKEGFLSGECDGLRRRCICQKDCNGNGGSDAQGPPEQGGGGDSDGGDAGQGPPEQSAAVNRKFMIMS
ncbi:hypothetical protein SASPL_130297 [Salvia splendens]|uniref:Knottins-like domain-containing protein n=1 Tax=Salvia splendens TaxID=180675 RepID=A0A8X8X3Y7_SALSN|nr:hypothetical protein SASPL_130297 [Salvia splendens]